VILRFDAEQDVNALVGSKALVNRAVRNPRKEVSTLQSSASLAGRTDPDDFALLEKDFFVTFSSIIIS